MAALHSVTLKKGQCHSTFLSLAHYKKLKEHSEVTDLMISIGNQGFALIISWNS